MGKKSVKENLPTNLSTNPPNQNQNQTNLTNPSANVPSYLQNYQGPTGLDNLKQYVVPPRLKIVQDQSGEQYSAFESGTVLLLPQMSLVAEPGQSFFITPIFQFTEFCVWNPWALKGQLPVIRERTANPKSEIAKLSRSKDTWSQPCPEADKKQANNPLYMLRYCEHINYIVVIKYNTELENNPFVISFHHSGYYDGSTLSTLVYSRRAPIFSGVYEFKTVPRSNQLGKWWGLQITNPSLESKVDSWNSKEDFENYSNFHNSFESLNMDGQIRPDYEEEVAEEVADSKGKF